MAKLLCAFLSLLSTLILTSTTTTASPSPSSSPSTTASNCTNVLMGMMDCLGFVEEGTNVTAPPPKCCSELKLVLKKNAECVCEGLKLVSGYGIKINTTRAVGLPQTCSVPSPDLSACDDSPSSPLPAPPAHPPTPAKPSPPPTPSTPSSAPPVSLPPPPSQPFPTPSVAQPISAPVFPPAHNTMPPSPALAPSSSSSIPPPELLLCVGVAIASLFSYWHII